MSDSIQNLFESLSPQEQNEVIDFIAYLKLKQEKQKNSDQNNKASLNWRGLLSEYKNQYTSLELQKKAQEWRGI